MSSSAPAPVSVMIRLPLVLLFSFTLHPLSSGAACEFKAEDGTCYGKDLRNRYFYLADNFTNLNHGSFGAVPRPVREQQHKYFLEQEAMPDTWFRKAYHEHLDASRTRIADLISASVDDVVLVENASSAVNSILRSMRFERGDKVLRLSTAYGMVVNTLNYLAQTAGIEIIVAEVAFPVEGPEQMTNAVEAALRAHPDMKLSIFSHISSMPAIIEPLGKMVKAVRSSAPSSMILVDGAHAPGVLKLNVPSYDVDFYLGNCHKWLYAPKGTAFLWVAPAQQSESFPEPTVISSSGRHDFIGKYSYTGTRDYTGFAALPSALDFRDFIGGDEQIYTYCHNLAIEAGKLLADAWGTKLLVPESMSGFMINILLPSKDEFAIKRMQETLNSTYGIYIVYGSVKQKSTIDPTPQSHVPPRDTVEVAPLPSSDTYFSPATPAFSDEGDGYTTLYVTRLSAQIYLDMDDFRALASLVPELLERGDTQPSAVMH